MGRNRRNQSGAVWLFPALKAGVLCALLGGSAVGYVLQKNLLHELGGAILKREAHLDQLKRQNKMRAQVLANLQLPQYIEQRAREQRLPLGKAQPGQTIWLSEPPAEARGATVPAMLVVDTATSMKSR